MQFKSSTCSDINCTFIKSENTPKSKVHNEQTSRSNKLANKKISLYFIVPEKVFNIQEAEKKVNPNVVDLNNTPNDDQLWWNQRNITHIDFSSNVLTEINPEIRNLQDLTVLNVSQ